MHQLFCPTEEEIYNELAGLGLDAITLSQETDRIIEENKEYFIDQRYTSGMFIHTSADDQSGDDVNICGVCWVHGHCGNCRVARGSVDVGGVLRASFIEGTPRDIHVGEEGEFLVRVEGMDANCILCNYYIGFERKGSSYISNSKRAIKAVYHEGECDELFDVVLINLFASQTEDNVILSDHPNCLLRYSLDKGKLLYTFEPIGEDFINDVNNRAFEPLVPTQITIDVSDDSNLSSGLGYKHEMMNVKKHLLKMYLPKDGRVMDFGIGEGNDIYKYLYSGVGMVVGIDRSLERLKECLKRYDLIGKEKSFDLVLYQAKFEDFVLHDELVSKYKSQIETVVDWFSLQYSCSTEASCARLISTIKQVLHPGGHAIFIYPSSIKMNELINRKNPHPYMSARGGVITGYKFGEPYRFKCPFYECSEFAVPKYELDRLLQTNYLEVILRKPVPEYIRDDLKRRHVKKDADSIMYDLLNMYTILVVRKPGTLSGRVLWRSANDPPKLFKVKKKRVTQI